MNHCEKQLVGREVGHDPLSGFCEGGKDKDRCGQFSLFNISPPKHQPLPSTMSAPTLAQIQTLYKSTLNAASRFASYNYRNHFIRRTDQLFKPVVSSLETSSQPQTQTQTQTSSSSLSRPNTNDLIKFYEEHTEELEVLKRAAEVNRMYAGQKLVVEHPSVITSGGGAGMEASSGGGGQPV